MGHSNAWLMSLFSLLFSEAAVGMNLYVLIHFLIAAAGVWVLARSLRLPFVWTLLIVVFFLFFPTHFQSYAAGHFNMMSVGFIPWFVWAFLLSVQVTGRRLGIRIRSWKYLGLTALFFALCLLSDYLPAAFLVFFCLFWYVYYRFSPAWYRLTPGWRVASLLLLFLALHVLTHMLRFGLNLSDNAATWFQSDISHYLLPTPGQQWIYHHWFPDVWNNKTNWPANFLGYGVLALLAYLLLSRRRIPHAAAPWLFVALLVVFFSLPELNFWGKNVRLNSPTAVLHYIPLLNQNRVPFRLQQIMWLCLGIGLAYWTAGRSGPVQKTVPLLLLVFCLIEWIPTPSFMPKVNMRQIPAHMQALAEQPGDVLLTIPVGIQDGERLEGKFDVNQMFFQHVHRKKLLGGYIARVPQWIFEERLADPAWRFMLHWSAKPAVQSPELEPIQEQAWKDFARVYKPDVVCIYPTYTHTPMMDSFIQLIRSQGFEPVRTVEGYQIWAKASADPVSPVSAQ